MITALKKIYTFSGRWKGVLKKSVVFSLLHSIFDMFQIGALFLILNGLVEGIKGQDILFAFLLLFAGVIGKIVCSYISDFSQTRVGYFMCADKRIHIGDRMKYMPMGYFNSHSLGNLTSTVTTTISDVENNAPSVLITVIHGFIHVTVITIVMFFFDWRIGLLACLGIALFLLCNSVLQKKSQEVSPKRQAAQEDLVGATLEYIQGMGIVKSFNLGGKSNQKMKQAIEESRARNTKLETVFGPYGMVQLFVLRLASVAIMFCSILFYLQGTPIIILDEATSSVDPENEAELQQAIEKLTEDKTVIIIIRELYPDVYTTDFFVDVTEEVMEIIRAAERAEAAYERKMYRYKAQ